MAEAFFYWNKGDELGSATVQKETVEQVLAAALQYLRTIGITNYPVTLYITGVVRGSALWDLYEDGEVKGALNGHKILPEEIALRNS